MPIPSDSQYPEFFKSICDYLRQDHPKTLEPNLKRISFWQNQKSRTVYIEIETGYIFTSIGKDHIRRWFMNSLQTDDIKILVLAFYHKHLKT